MNKINKKYIIAAAAVVIGMLTFIFFPVKKADLHLRIYFSSDSALPVCSIYYTTSEEPDFSLDRLIYPAALGQTTDIILPAETYSDLSVLRLDLSETENVICITKVELRSAGFTIKSYSANEFFAKEHIFLTNDIVWAESEESNDTCIYIRTSGNDPYIVFSSEISEDCRASGRGYRITRLFICIFVAAAIWISHKKIFITDQKECL